VLLAIDCYEALHGATDYGVTATHHAGGKQGPANSGSVYLNRRVLAVEELNLVSREAAVAAVAVLLRGVVFFCVSWCIMKSADLRPPLKACTQPSLACLKYPKKPPASTTTTTTRPRTCAS